MKMNLAGVPVNRKPKGKGKASKKSAKKVPEWGSATRDGGVR